MPNGLYIPQSTAGITQQGITGLANIKETQRRGELQERQFTAQQEQVEQQNRFKAGQQRLSTISALLPYADDNKFLSLINEVNQLSESMGIGSFNLDANKTLTDRQGFEEGIATSAKLSKTNPDAGSELFDETISKYQLDEQPIVPEIEATTVTAREGLYMSPSQRIEEEKKLRRQAGATAGLEGERLLSFVESGKVPAAAAGKLPTAATTVIVGDKIKQWNSATQRYDIEVGAAPSKGKGKDLTGKAALRASEAKQKIGIVLNKIDEATDQLGFFSTGATAQFSKWLDASPAGQLANTVVTIQAITGFDELRRMKESSPTGGALGQVSEFELKNLQSVIASMEVGQPEDQLRNNLKQIKNLYINLRANMNLGEMIERNPALEEKINRAKAVVNDEGERLFSPMQIFQRIRLAEQANTRGQ